MRKPFDFHTEAYDKLSISQLKRMTDYWLRKYLLYCAEKNAYGNVKCELTGKWYSPKNLHVCHYVDRGNICTRYDLNNVSLINKNSNMWDSKVMVEGYKSKHHKEYSELLGEKKVGELLRKSKELCIFAREDYVEKIKKFREVGNQ